MEIFVVTTFFYDGTFSQALLCEDNDITSLDDYNKILSTLCGTDLDFDETYSCAFLERYRSRSGVFYESYLLDVFVSDKGPIPDSALDFSRCYFLDDGAPVPCVNCNVPVPLELKKALKSYYLRKTNMRCG
jgi:hypothetical protein